MHTHTQVCVHVFKSNLENGEHLRNEKIKLSQNF